MQPWTASSTSYIFVLMSVVAVALGARVADERITVTTIIGGGIVCAASTSALSRDEMERPKPRAALMATIPTAPLRMKRLEARARH